MKNKSIWLETKKPKTNASLNQNIDVDILIIGGGLTGISTAYELKDSNQKICLVERNTIGQGTTGNTTGKLTFLQAIKYSKIQKIRNQKISKKYYESQIEALKIAENIIQKENIDCDFIKTTSYVYADAKKEIKKLTKEAKLLTKFKADIKINNNQNFKTISTENSFVFHPLKYLYALEEICLKSNIAIYENTPIISLKKINNKYLCQTSNNYQIKANKVVIACHYPFFLFPFFMP